MVLTVSMIHGSPIRITVCNQIHQCLCGVSSMGVCQIFLCFFFFQAEDGIRDLVRSRGLGDVYKRQVELRLGAFALPAVAFLHEANELFAFAADAVEIIVCLLYTSDAADERSSVDLGGRRIIKKKNI